MDNQDPYIKMVFQNAVEQIRAFGTTLEQLQKHLTVILEQKPKSTKIACVGSLPDFDAFAEKLFSPIYTPLHLSEVLFDHNAVTYIHIHDARPKGFYPKCDAIVFLGGYLNPRYSKVIEDLESQQQIYLIDPIQLLNLIK